MSPWRGWPAGWKPDREPSEEKLNASPQRQQGYPLLALRAGIEKLSPADGKGRRNPPAEVQRQSPEREKAAQ
jgi:hypothetical protein